MAQYGDPPPPPSPPCIHGIPMSTSCADCLLQGRTTVQTHRMATAISKPWTCDVLITKDQGVFINGEPIPGVVEYTVEASDIVRFGQMVDPQLTLVIRPSSIVYGDPPIGMEDESKDDTSLPRIDLNDAIERMQKRKRLRRST